jgi:hypothetical protein
MEQFTITEDFPKNQAAFDARFSSEETCRAYLLMLRWTDPFLHKVRRQAPLEKQQVALYLLSL